MNKDQLINNYIEALKKNPGLKPEEFLISNSDHETLSVLRMTQAIMSLPKKSVPEPVMRRKFILAPLPQERVTFFVKLSRFTSIGISAMVVALVTLTAFAASNALPGEKLFTLKRAAERVQLQLTVDPIQKANLQLSFAQRRLAEAHTIFSNPDNSGLEAAALTAVSEQTKTAADEVKNVVTASKTSSPLVASLQDVATKQKDLLAQVNQNSQSQNIPSNALASAQADQVKLNEIVKIVAANNDETPVATTTASGTPAVTATTTPIQVTSSATSTAPTGTSSPVTQKKADDTAMHVAPATTSPDSTSTPPDPNTAIGTFIPEGPNQ